MKKINLKNIGKKKIIIAIGILIILIAIIFSFKPKKEEETKIETEEIEKRSIGTSIAATGVIKTETSQDVVATLTGSKIESVNVKEGDKVSVGDVICKFDTSTIKDNLSIAKETLDLSKKQGNLGVQGARRSLNDAITGKDTQVNMSQIDVNSAYKAYQDAEEQLSTAQKDLENKKNALSSFKSNAVKQKEADYKNKEKAYQNAQNDHNKKSQSKADAEANYNRYFKDGAKLDPNTGAALTSEPTPGQFIPSHNDVRLAYEKAQAELSNSKTALDVAKTAYEKAKAEYETALQGDSAYKAMVAEVATAEANVNTLKSTVDSLKSAYEKALQAHSSTVSTADS